MVDDHEISRRYTVAALREIAGTVKHTHSASEALEMSFSWHPDLIMLDFHLPEMNGLALAKRVRQGWPRNCPAPRIILLSAEDFDEQTRIGTEIDQFLTKPVSANLLKSSVRSGQPDGVSEAWSTQHPDLAVLFRQELETRVPQLDRCISALDLPGARNILHQLIASSAICGENELEQNLRALDLACKQDNSDRNLASSYFTFVNTARAYLQGVEPIQQL